MSKTLTRRGFLFVSAFIALALVLPASCLRADEAKSTGKCMMWKATSPTATVYLVGSLHMATADIYPLPKEMEAAFEHADTLVVEANTNKIDQAQMFALVQAKGMYQGNDTLSANIKKETYDKVTTTCTSFGLPAEAVNKMKPWLLSMTIEVLEATKAGFDPNSGIDKHFLDAAGKSDKKIEELESAEFQIDLLAGLDDKLQEAGLEAAVTDPDQIKQVMTELVAAWKAGDPEAVEKTMHKRDNDFPGIKEYTKKLITDRNEAMTQKVEGYLRANKTVFVIAGCGHMVGEKGIVEVLRSHHFQVEQSAATPAPASK